MNSIRTTPKGQMRGVLANNKLWAASMTAQDPEFFDKLKNQQAPEFFWIGCSDSRVPANEIMGLAPGEVFVQRNVGNLATHKDLNCMTCLEFAVNHLKVKHVIVCGHYNCGAVRGALTFPAKTSGLANLWISDIRDVRNKHSDMLKQLSPEGQLDRLCELNVQRQIFNICTSPVVQAAWSSGQELAIHGIIYSVGDGLLKELSQPISGLADVAEYESEIDYSDAPSPALRDFTKQLAGSVRSHMSWEKANIE